MGTRSHQYLYILADQEERFQFFFSEIWFQKYQKIGKCREITYMFNVINCETQVIKTHAVDIQFNIYTLHNSTVFLNMIQMSKETHKASKLIVWTFKILRFTETISSVTTDNDYRIIEKIIFLMQEC